MSSPSYEEVLAQGAERRQAQARAQAKYRERCRRHARRLSIGGALFGGLTGLALWATGMHLVLVLLLAASGAGAAWLIVRLRSETLTAMGIYALVQCLMAVFAGLALPQGGHLGILAYGIVILFTLAAWPLGGGVLGLVNASFWNDHAQIASRAERRPAAASSRD